jgi:hypothetical protein
MEQEERNMRLIDADALKTSVPKTSEDIFENCRNCKLLDDWQVKELIDNAPTVEPASPWHRVEEPPRDGQECIVAYSGPTDWIYEHATYHSDLNKALEEDIFVEGTDGFIVDGDVGYARHSFNYWMPIEPPKEDA